jgi:phosphoribosylamine--glycine ligase
MRILVVGQGGREHAIVRALNKSDKVEQVYCAPGNGGIARDAICLPIAEMDFAGLAAAAKEYAIDLTFVGPENPLFAGIVDYFIEQGLVIVGPNKLAAEIEGSKAFAKELMQKYNIPTGTYRSFNSSNAAKKYLQEVGAPIVIKADGLAAGKGVIVAHKLDEAFTAVDQMLEDKAFGAAGERILIEEFLTGEELTVMAFVDGETVLPMEPAQDHKAVYDNDLGPNTGGMGAYSPVPQMSKALLKQVYDEILVPTAKGMVAEGRPFKGILYAGLMITAEGIKVIEFNARFGDPETQVVLPRLKTDLVDILVAMNQGSLADIKLSWDSRATVAIVMASAGYPGSYEKGKPISIDELPEGTELYIAGAEVAPGNALVTSGGRVLSLTALGENIKGAQELAYQGISKIDFAGAHYRTDIANKAIKEADTSNIHELVINGKRILLIGTAHVSHNSVEEVKNVIEFVRPDTVAVELCDSRYQTIENKATWENMDIVKVIKTKQTTLLLVNLILSAYQKRMAKQLGIQAGQEMIQGIESAKEIGANLVLADRRIDITFKRILGNLTAWDKIKFMFQLIISVFIDEEITAADVERLKSEDMLDSALNELSTAMPSLKVPLVDERDTYLAQKIREAPGETIVAVLGAAHLPGVLQQIKVDNDLEQLVALPPKKKTGKIVAWAIPVLIIGIIVATFIINRDAGVQQIISWVLWNGTLAGLGGLIMLAHPLTILTAFAVAPISSLNPLFAAGWAAGAVEFFVRKPHVKDFENIAQDASTLKGFWKNRVIRVLMVAVFVNIGSVVGTIIGGTDVVRIFIENLGS